MSPSHCACLGKGACVPELAELEEVVQIVERERLEFLHLRTGQWVWNWDREATLESSASAPFPCVTVGMQIKHSELNVPAKMGF